MRLERIGEREHTVTDIVLLLGVVCLALLTWASLATAAATAPFWKTHASLAVTLLFALAGLIRNPDRAAAIRVLTGGWLLTAPLLLGYAPTGPALWAHLGFGALLVAMSMPGVAGLRSRRPRLEA